MRRHISNATTGLDSAPKDAWSDGQGGRVTKGDVPMGFGVNQAVPNDVTARITANAIRKPAHASLGGVNMAGSNGAV